MRFEMFALPLLALARGVLASPCLPQSSSLSVTTTASSETVSTASTESSTESSIVSTESTTATTASTESTTTLTITESTIASASESVSTSATLSTAFTESTESTTASAESTTSSAMSTASTESTTILTTTESTSTSPVQSTTTSSEPEPQETNLLVNGGFESSTPQPWSVFSPGNSGSLGISTEQFYTGQQSGTYEHSENTHGLPWGIYQAVDKTRLVAWERYLVTIRIRVPSADCSDLSIAISSGNGGVSSNGQSFIYVGHAVDRWLEAKAMFRFTPQQINLVPGVAIISQCESVSFWIDEVSMVKHVEPTTD